MFHQITVKQDCAEEQHHVSPLALVGGGGLALARLWSLAATRSSIRSSMIRLPGARRDTSRDRYSRSTLRIWDHLGTTRYARW